MSWRQAVAPAAVVVGAAITVLGIVFPFRPLFEAPGVVFSATEYMRLGGWREGDHRQGLIAFRRSCPRLDEARWRRPCEAAGAVDAVDREAAREFFETWFRPHAVTENGRGEGLFTGYFEIALRGARHRRDGFAAPIYRRPGDLVTVALGRFDAALRGRRVAGRVVDGRLRPYPDRAAIDRGALAGRGLELAWVDDPVGAFFLHVQGSGRILLADGATLRVGFDGSNGRPYVAIGRTLVARGVLTPQSVSLQGIRAWLKDHPDEAAAVMAANPRYIFFRRLGGGGPVGALGVALSPGRSLAVDPRFVPLGAPLWLDITAPDAALAGPDGRMRRLVVAQDTGAAIKGAVRGDLFWGYGARAEAVAGRMKSRGRYYLLLPIGGDP